MEGSPGKKGVFRDAPVLDQYGLSCENDMSLLVQEDLIALGRKITQFHSRILCVLFMDLNHGSSVSQDV